MELLQAIGFSAPAGLNAYLALLLVGLAGRFGAVDLTGTWGERLTNPWILGALAVLTVWEIVVDKLPGADHLNDIAGTVIRPLAGAVLMLATPNVLTDQQPVVAAGLGAGLAGGLHALKALFRPVVTVSTGGLGNAVVSFIEDVGVAGTIVIALIAPALVLLLIALVLWAVWWAFRRWRRRRARPEAALS